MTPKFDSEVFVSAPAWLQSRIVFMTLAGSHAYGTSTPASDVDWRGIAVPPLSTDLNPFSGGFDSWSPSAGDITVYSLRKFFRLAADGNPNVLELLFTPPRCHSTVSRSGEKLLRSRDLFLSRKVARTFGGFALSQRKGLRTGAPDLSGKTSTSRIESYRKWGYDTKDAMHLIRILRSGRDLLKTGELIVERGDVPELMSIRRGERSYESILAEADAILAQFPELEGRSPLPPSPPISTLIDLYVEIREGCEGLPLR